MTLLNALIPTITRPPGRRGQERDSELGPTVRPVYELKETPEAWGATVYLPGVTKDGLELTAEEGQIRIVGRRSWKQPDGWTCLYRETADAAYELVLTHDNAIDTDKVAAELRDGVLRVSLPKQEKIKPRKIAIS